MSEKICICPHLSRVSEGFFLCAEGTITIRRDNGRLDSVLPDYKCALWENGDCGLKVARGDRYKEMWETAKAFVNSNYARPTFANDMIVKIRELEQEAEMGKG